ncbi:MAG: insulinase family protein [Rickettsiaceae bacterium H1]|nr:insulinase family protein [Rickettsiaceae bacterium H1]
MLQNNPKLTILPNGFRIITDRMEQVDSVAMSVWVNAGSRCETEKNCGIAHFLEHMAFKGTASRSATDIAKEFDAIGGQFNAYTGKEETVYYAKVLKENFTKALDIIADILLSPNFDEVEIEKERGVVLQEIAQTEDHPDDILFDKYVETAYPGQSLGRPILGTPELVNSFGREHLRDFTKKNYYSNNMLLSVAGNIGHEEVVSIAEKLFSILPENKSSDSVERAEYKGGDFREKRDLEQIHIALGFNGCSYYDNSYYPIQVLSLILGGGMSSRLFQEVREKHGLAYSIAAFNKSYKDVGLLTIYSGTEPDKIQKLLDIVSKEVKKIADKINEDELKRAKSQIKSSLLMNMENNSSRVDVAGSSYVRYDRYVSKQEILEKIDCITTGQLEDLMKSILESCQPITVTSIGKIDKVPDFNDIVNTLY